MRTPRAEGVGSLIRPRAVTEAIADVFGDATSAARALVQPQKVRELRRLTEACDRAIPDLLARQASAGLDVVTDGEIRRTIFLSSFYDALDGLEPAAAPLVAHDHEGKVAYRGYADPLIAQRLRKVAAPLAEEVAFLRGVAPAPFKVTLPSPSYFYSEWVSVQPGAYATRDELVAHVVELERAIVADSIAAGARWVQFDFPIYPALIDTGADGLAARVGETAASMLEKAIRADADVVAGLAPDTTTALHLCRGNLDGGFWSGTLAPIAERLFHELPYDRFLFEWDAVQGPGDWPIRHVPPGRVVTLGLVNTKTATVETEDEIIRRIDAAAEHLGLDQLALSPQCGFASVYDRDRGEDVQWRKLELVGRVAERVWGGA